MANYKFFIVQQLADCCGSRIFYGFNTVAPPQYDPWSGKRKANTEEDNFSDDNLTTQLKQAMRDASECCFFWVQLTTTQAKVFEPGILAAGFQKVAVGLNGNTDHVLHAYLFNSRPRYTVKSWMSLLKAFAKTGV